MIILSKKQYKELTDRLDALESAVLKKEIQPPKMLTTVQKELTTNEKMLKELLHGKRAGK